MELETMGTLLLVPARPMFPTPVQPQQPRATRFLGDIVDKAAGEPILKKNNLSLFFDNDNDSVICNNQPVGLNNKSKDIAK